MKHCYLCGQEVSDTAKFCKHCGAKLDQESLNQDASNEIVIKEDETIVDNEQVITSEVKEKSKKKDTKKVKTKKKGNGKNIAMNVLWLIFGGALWGIGLWLGAILLFVSIIGIPSAFQYMKAAKFVFSPFGKEKYVVKKGFWRTLANVFWCISIGLGSFLSLGLWGVILCITIIGIPFGKQYFKIAKFIIWPFGRDFKAKEN